MFNQLRSVYPEGCLITELVSVKHCRYIVRALLQVSGITLATSLASADTVELAEEKAQNRLLNLLGVQIKLDDGDDLQSALLAPPPVNNLDLNSNFAPVINESSIYTTTIETISTPVSLTTLPDIPVLHNPLGEESTTEELTISEQIAVTEEKIKTKKTSSKRKMEKSNVMLEETRIKQEEEAQSIVNHQSNFDNSDLLAKTTVEIKRLGWTNQQGREHLIATYGKTTRAELNDEELLDFLTYLQSLNTTD